MDNCELISMFKNIIIFWMVSKSNYVYYFNRCFGILQRYKVKVPSLAPLAVRLCVCASQRLHLKVEIASLNFPALSGRTMM